MKIDPIGGPAYPKLRTSIGKANPVPVDFFPGGIGMATVGDLIFELERGEELSDLVLSDLTIIGGTVASTLLVGQI